MALLNLFAFLLLIPVFASAHNDRGFFVIPENSSNETINPGKYYTGEWVEVDKLGISVQTAVITDQKGTLYMEFAESCPNGVATKRSSLSYNINANPDPSVTSANEVHQLGNTRKCYRTRFLNTSDNPQSYFSLQTTVGNFGSLTAPVNLTMGLDADARVVRPTIAQDEIRIGRREGITGFTKFAYRDGLTASAGEQVIWTNSGNTFTPMETAGTYTITYNSSNDGEGTNGALTLAITHVDEDGNPETFVHTLGNDGSDVTTQTGTGINRVAVASSGSADSNVSDIVITATSGSTVQADIRAGNSVTEQAIFHAGFNHDAVAKWLWLKAEKLTGGTDVRATVRGYVYNKNIDTRFLVFRTLIDTRSDSEINLIDPIGFNLSPSDVIYFTIDTSIDASEIDLRFSLNQYQRN